MTTDTQLAPTDDEIDALNDQFRWDTTEGRRDMVREVLARWGQPAHSGEPVAWLYTTPMPDGSTFVGASSERLQIGIEVTPGTIEQPLFTAPQPVEREPLTDEQIDAAAKKLAECMEYPWEYMPEPGRKNMRKHAQAVLEAAHGIGIKGGQHGAE